MQRKNGQKEPPSQNIMATILRSIPQGAHVTKIEYEGPSIAIYTSSPKFLLGQNKKLSTLVSAIKKRIVVRTDDSIRRPQGRGAEGAGRPRPK